MARPNAGDRKLGIVIWMESEGRLMTSCERMLKDQKYSEHFSNIREHYDTVISGANFDKLCIYSGGRKLRFRDDIAYPFHASPYFKAVVPVVDRPNIWVLWVPGKKPALIIYHPDDIWHAPPEALEGGWMEHFEIAVVSDLNDVGGCFGNLHNSAFIGEEDAHTNQFEFSEVNPHELMLGLSRIRIVKSGYEIFCLKKAVERSVAGHLAVRDAFFEGCSELEIAHAFERGAGSRGEGLAYPSIIAQNENAAVLHYDRRSPVRMPAADMKSLLVDAGAEYAGYAADVSRTYAYGEGASLFSDILAMLDHQQKLMADATCVGVSYYDLNIQAMGQIAEILIEAGVLSMEPSEALESGVIRHFFPHPLGHFLGLQVHDVGQKEREEQHNDKMLEAACMMGRVQAGHVVTVEPGIYFIKQLLKKLSASAYRTSVNWEKVDELIPFGGMRIEDNIEVRENGPANLTRECFEAHD